MKKLGIIFLTFIFFFLQFSLPAQNARKSIVAVPVNTPLKIDGILDEEAWANAPLAGDFIQRKPYNGAPATFKTEVKFLYDNTGLYVGATLYDPSPDSILTQLGLRDAQNLNADYFMLMLSPFDDGINAFCFAVYASDVQADFKIPGGDSYLEEDLSWDAVWHSKARKNEKGWVVEMKIPYSAIRFPRQEIQHWGINCQRDIRRYRENSSWNFVDSKIEGYVNQSGLMEGIREIRPPLRLSISPYVSGYVEKNPENPDWQFTYNYGADLKYGIDQSFTLDMTLIPDFGQVQSDDKIYNFTPFEIQYNEKRQFFTEGTELFNKTAIFYTRRIGGEPKGYNLVPDSSEKVIENPAQTRLLNATKVSGRTKGGLGIGVFNAISGNTWAEVQDTITGVSRKVLTQGFTNYNMLVFDQALKNNSYIDLLNTNYYLADSGYFANVTGTDFKLANRSYTYAFMGDAFISQKYYSHAATDLGYHYSLAFGKISGNFRFTYNQLLETERYDPNDMGFNERNNKFNNVLVLNYNIYEPFGKFLETENSLRFAYNCLYDGFRYTSFTINSESLLTTWKHLTVGGRLNLTPVESHDYYEPRVPGYMYVRPADYGISPWISTDYRKKVALDLLPAFYLSTGYKASGIGITIGPRYRVSDRLLLIYRLGYENFFNDVGYVLDSTDAANNTVILFGRRDLKTITNVFSANFMFSSSMSIDFRLRHYWVTTPYYSFYRLRDDGHLDPVDYRQNQDLDYNLFNIDLTYIWNFAPGSQLSLVWKNAINTVSNSVDNSYYNNFNEMVGSPASNSFSIRVLYYIDAMYLKKKRSSE
ncbi:MAG: DUF5916 domain-containing protein [Bacteroidetes bacterium]|nr:DUF5916 domain-containing protein [Bacteroidota bacterium]